MDEEKYWKITDFTEEINKHIQEKFEDDQLSIHYNTIDKWFKFLENKKIHFVMRVTTEKVYDKLDLEIACFIYERRRDKWNLDPIFNDLHNFFELRVLSQESDESPVATLEMDKVKLMIQSEMELYKEELLQEVEAVTQKEINKFKNLLPSPEDAGEEKKDYLMTSLQASMELQKLALKAWEELPEDDRMKKTGWFRKEEDTYKRELFISKYKQDNYEDMIIKILKE